MWLLKALKSSIGQKIVMAVTGLLLCGFLIAHLAGNLLLYVSPEAYNNYAHQLHSQEGLLMIAETGLFALFFAHLVLAGSTRKRSRDARDVDYVVKASKIDDSETSVFEPQSWMFASGAVILAFILLHLTDFKLEMWISADGEREPFDKAVLILSDWIRVIAYIVGPIILAIHLTHGIPSAFQSLGLSHPKYNGLIKKGSWLFAWAIGLAFASFPIWAMLQ